MRILFVSKRKPQQRDLLDRPYGRFHYLPTSLARRGHDVAALICAYDGGNDETRELGGVCWTSRDIRSSGPAALLRAFEADAHAFAPDWVVACSDAWYGWLGQRLARRVGARLLVDAYDNYEAYMPWNLPLHWAWRRAVRAADRVTVPGPQLAALLNRQRRSKPCCDIVPMAADPGFSPRDRGASRAELALPLDAPLIGYMGGWAGNRGTDILLTAFHIVREHRADARLVLTGRPPAHALETPGVLSLGYLPDAQLPVALSALDVACVITADTSFGRYSYPAKLCEAMACGVPVVATATEPVCWMLGNDARHTVPVGDAHAIAARILESLASPCVAYPAQPTWDDAAARMATVLGSDSATHSRHLHTSSN